MGELSHSRTNRQTPPINNSSQGTRTVEGPALALMASDSIRSSVTIALERLYFG